MHKVYSDGGVIPIVGCLCYQTKFGNSSVVPQGRLILIIAPPYLTGTGNALALALLLPAGPSFYDVRNLGRARILNNVNAANVNAPNTRSDSRT